MRRPPVDGRPVAKLSSLRLLALFLALPVTPYAEATTDHGAEAKHASRIEHAPVESPLEGRLRQQPPQEIPSRNSVMRNPAATVMTNSRINPDTVEIRPSSQIPVSEDLGKARRDDDLQPVQVADEGIQHNTNPQIEDASAIATLAPGKAVRAPSPRRRSGTSALGGSGISTPQSARRLEDWEVEDFVLLATVDGDLYASNRKTGEERWHLEVEQPMVETTHHRADNSILDDDYSPVDHYLWAVEPNRDGGLYLWIPDSGAGLIRTGFTMKKLVEELSPYADGDPPVVYTGDKKTTMVTLDAATGRVLKWFGSAGSQVSDEDSCTVLNAFENDECSTSAGTITLGRTEYIVGIQRKDGRPIATLKYSEWTPNNFDNDLLQQYSTTMDDSYITSRHDGFVYGIKSRRGDDGRPYFSRKFPAPVARVFDVARPWGAAGASNPELVVLPQPPPPAEDDEVAFRRSNSIFLNQTSAGSWYAMSGRAYPFVLDAPKAEISMVGFRDQPSADWSNSAHLSKILVGTHSLGGRDHVSARTQYPSLPGSTLSPIVDDNDDDDIAVTLPMPTPEPSTFIETAKTLPILARNKVIEFVWNPMWVIVMITVFFSYRNEIRRRVKALFTVPSPKHKRRSLLLDSVDGLPQTPTVETKNVEILPVDKPAAISHAEPEMIKTTESDELAIEPQTEKTLPEASDKVALEQSSPENSIVLPVEKEKKAHRGRRGGTKHRKGKKREESSSMSGEPTINSVEEAVQNAKTLGSQPAVLEPDLQTLSNRVEEVSNPVLKIADSLQVDEDQQLGTGSNGTIVYAGTWEGRPVAVKRMLRDFYDIASQETKLLRESDDHPNVIRYYAQQQRGNFIYIALELCKASLGDVVEKPALHRELALAGERDMQSVLYQIANGLDHLHSLRIVHRDLKPQNILVNMQANGKHRILVSDFGLCKKLEGGQSSFGATTAHAAGTSGWRAPELLLDDDSRDMISMMDTHSSTHTDPGSNAIISPELVARRATRSIDIFSLGLVFFYVLSKGSHPFDCGDRYMREVNIRKDNFNLDKLYALGDVAFEAIDLISGMIKAAPRERPSTQDVMAHPFFWTPKKRLNFLCDVSDHFEKEQREPPSDALVRLESYAAEVTAGGDFLKKLPPLFVDSLGKQRKYTGAKLLDLLRALRNKRNHYEDMSEGLKRMVGPLPEGYLGFWTTRFPSLLLTCWNAVYEVGWDDTDRFREYYMPAGL